MSGYFHIVSLGHRCRTTQRLREHFGYTTAFPFDWWITPVEGLIRFMHDWDADRLYRSDQLFVRHNLFQKAWVENREYGFRLVHEFTRDRWRLASRRFLEEVPVLKARTAHLMARFDDLDPKQRTVLFVRTLMASEEGDAAAFEELRRAVIARVPRARPEFVLISRTGIAAEGWIPLKIDDPSTERWSGDPVVWDTALSTLGFHLHRPGIPQPLRPLPDSPLDPVRAPLFQRLGLISGPRRREA